MAIGVRSEEIYEALFDDEAFAKLPSLLAAAGNGRSTILQWRHVDYSSEMFAYSYFSKEFMGLYAEKYVDDDPWMKMCINPPIVNRVVAAHQYVPFAVFDKSIVARDLVDAQGDDTRHSQGIVFRSQWGDGILSVMRGRRAGPFELADMQPLETCAAHLGRLLRVRGELAAHRRDARISRDTLDSLALATAVVKGDGRAVSLNMPCEVVVRRADGLLLKDGILSCLDHSSALRLTSAIQAATANRNATGTAVVIVRGRSEPSYLVTVTPLRGQSGAGLALLMFRDPDVEDATLVGRLRSLFGLTQTEAQIAADLSKGLSPRHIALRRGVRANTIKTQIASLAAKLGCNRQSEIAALVAGLPTPRL